MIGFVDSAVELQATMVCVQKKVLNWLPGGSRELHVSELPRVARLTEICNPERSVVRSRLPSQWLCC